MCKYLTVPMSKQEMCELRAGESVYLSGTIYTARDAAHKRMYETIQKGESLPIEIQNQMIYYMGPSPAREGRVIGSAGPTTSSRMDAYTPMLLELGLGAVIGKGKRNQEVVESLKAHQAVYFAAIGGAGALLSKSIQTCEVVAYDDLGTEAIHKLEVKDFPAIVIIDTLGNNLYEQVSEQH